LIDAVPNFQSATIAIRRSWASKNRPVMVRFMKAMVRSHRWLHDNRDAAVEFIAKEMQLKPAHALKGWEYYTQNRIWPVDGEPNIEGMKQNLRAYAEQTGAKGGPPDVRRFLELSYLNEALSDLGKR
jgi:ABC-type nitrate/sulfonate/bicarbonate transport system substrate-binding protein